MKLKSRILAMLLALLCVVGLLGLAACGKDGDPKDTDKQQGAETGLTNEQILAGTVLEHPALNNLDATFTILGPGPDDNEWACKDFFAESESDDPIVSAVYKRQSLIEDQLGIKFKYEQSTRNDIPGKVQTDGASGLANYDLVMSTVNNCYNLAQGGYILELNEDNLPYLDLSSESWDQSYLAQMSVNGRNYFATGDITTMDNDGTWVMMFNKKLAQDYEIGGTYLYDLVKQGKWTVDELLRLSRMFEYNDANQNGKMDSKDQFAIASSNDMATGLFFSMGGRVVVKNEQDRPTFQFNTTQNSTIVQKVVELFFRENRHVFSFSDYLSEDAMGYPLSQSMFSENRALFYSEVMQVVVRLRDMQTDFGILPMPKLNTEQTDYTTFTVRETLLCACFEKSLSNERAEIASLVAQALAELGTKILEPAYYEKSIVGVGVRDEESLDMLPIIFANRTCDIGYANDASLSSFWTDGVMKSVLSGSANVASIAKSWEGRVNNKLNTMIKKFDQNAN